MRAQLRLPALDHSWILTGFSMNIKTIVMYSSQSLTLDRKDNERLQFCRKTNHPAMRAQLHLPALDLSWALTNRQAYVRVAFFICVLRRGVKPVCRAIPKICCSDYILTTTLCSDMYQQCLLPHNYLFISYTNDS